MKTLVLGMGNTILCDDGIGIYVTRAAAERCQRDDVDFCEASVGELRLLDVIGIESDAKTLSKFRQTKSH